MEKDQLAQMLDEGWSLERIGRHFGKHPSTIGYWLKKHGLRAANKDKYAPRGGIPRAQLAALVEAGCTLREISERLGFGVSAVRHWLARYGLQTAAAARRESRRSGVPLAPETTQHCRTHGDTRFILEGRGYYRCAKCRSARVAERRRKVKRILVEEAGGRCILCGYDRHPAALEFHHLDPAAKSYGLAIGGVTRAIDELRAEARKCVLLCATCHAEVEAGAASLPTPKAPPTELAA
jgi:helix-turn-helix protein